MVERCEVPSVLLVEDWRGFLVNGFTGAEEGNVEFGSDSGGM